MTKRNQTAAKVILGVYCLILIWIILLKASFTLGEIALLMGNRSLNLIPFYQQEAIGFLGRETILNIIVFIPFGFYLHILDVSKQKAVLYGFFLSLLLETAQFVLSMGASDVTDLITNTLGTAVGVYAYHVTQKIFRNKAKADRVIHVLASVAILLFLSMAALLFASNHG